MLTTLIPVFLPQLRNPLSGRLRPPIRHSFIPSFLPNFCTSTAGYSPRWELRPPSPRVPEQCRVPSRVRASRGGRDQWLTQSYN